LPTFAQDYRRRQAVEAFNDWFVKQQQEAKIALNFGGGPSESENEPQQ
jgi:hypothetical protein